MDALNEGPQLSQSRSSANPNSCATRVSRADRRHLSHGLDHGVGGKTIGYASTKDFIHWAEQRALPVMAHEPTVKKLFSPRSSGTRAAAVPHLLGLDHSGPVSWRRRRAGITTTVSTAPRRGLLSPSPRRSCSTSPASSVIDATMIQTDEGHCALSWGRINNPWRRNTCALRWRTIPKALQRTRAAFTRIWVEGRTALRGRDFTSITTATTTITARCARAIGRRGRM